MDDDRLRKTDEYLCDVCNKMRQLAAQALQDDPRIVEYVAEMASLGVVIRLTSVFNIQSLVLDNFIVPEQSELKGMSAEAINALFPDSEMTTENIFRKS